jgi:hypothetical protein
MINFDAVQHNQFSSNLKKQNGILMRLISSLIWAKKKFILVTDACRLQALRASKIFFFGPKVAF